MDDLPHDTTISSCNACGTRLVVGWSCSKHKPQITSKRSPHNSKAKAAGAVQLVCSCCGATTIVAKHRPERSGLKATTSVEPDSRTVNAQTSASLSSTTSTSSGHRKARNKTSSLQSLLASRATSSNVAAKKTGGLAIQDYMKR